jgi:hypothetical protein
MFAGHKSFLFIPKAIEARDLLFVVAFRGMTACHISKT